MIHNGTDAAQVHNQVTSVGEGGTHQKSVIGEYTHALPTIQLLTEGRWRLQNELFEEVGKVAGIGHCDWQICISTSAGTW